jgi:hypothetical protein
VSALVYVLLALAAYRMARVVTTDSISLAFRERLYRWTWDDTNPEVQREPDGTEVFVPKARAPWRTYAYELFTCPLCLGFWAAAAVYSAWRWWDTDAVHAVIAVFAIAGLQCFLATREGA